MFNNFTMVKRLRCFADLDRYIHSVHHRYNHVNIWVAQYDHPFELVSLGFLGTISPLLICTHPLTTWAFMMLNDWVAAESHGGYDLSGLPQRWVPFWGGSTKHHMHHLRPLTNYEPYFNWIDRLVGNECPGIWAGGYRSKELVDWEKRNLRRYLEKEGDHQCGGNN
jgi:cholesterol 25-hydroxylase